MTSVQLLITSLYYLELATNHHLSLLAKIDHFVLNTDGTWSEFICLKSKLSRWNTGKIIGKRALILSIVGHEKKSELNIQQYVRKQMVFLSPRVFISISADLSVASLNSWARLFFCWTYISVQILKNLLRAFAKDREWVPRNISSIPIFLKYGSYTGLPAFAYFICRWAYLVYKPKLHYRWSIHTLILPISGSFWRSSFLLHKPGDRRKIAPPTGNHWMRNSWLRAIRDCFMVLLPVSKNTWKVLEQNA